MPIHIYTAPNVRVRHKCPYHNRLECGNKQEFYDSTRVFFDCGTMADYGYGYYQPPEKFKRLEIFKDEGDTFSIFARYTHRFFTGYKTLAAAKRIAKCHLKEGGNIKVLPK
jgi:hypothetical protein